MQLRLATGAPVEWRAQVAAHWHGPASPGVRTVRCTHYRWMAPPTWEGRSWLGPSCPLWQHCHAFKTLFCRFLAENYFSATLPPAWGEMKNIFIVDLADNRLSGTLPSAWGTGPMARTLAYLDLKGNGFSGTVPAPWGAMTKLLTVDLSNNPLLSGCLPASWRNLPDQESGAAWKNTRITGCCG